MFKPKLFASLLVIVSAVLLTHSVNAATTYTGVKLRIEAPNKTFYNDTVYVASTGCKVTDSAGTVHQLTQPVALCALKIAAKTDSFKYTVDNTAFGLYLSAIGKTVATDTKFWLFDVNYQAASVGLDSYVVHDGDKILLTYGDWPSTALKLTTDRAQVVTGQTLVATVQTYDDVSQTFLPVSGATVYFNHTKKTTDSKGQASFVPKYVGTVVLSAKATGDTRSENVTVPVFPANTKINLISAAERADMIQRATGYLQSKIATTGLVNNSQSTTEWTALALAANHQSNAQLTAAVLKYEPTVQAGTSELARHILAIAAVGANPRKVNGINYVSLLKQTETDQQFGSTLYVNDDIFAGLALVAAGAPNDAAALQDAVQFALASVKADGGVSYSVNSTVSEVDTTGYFVQLLRAVGGHAQALHNAEHYLEKQQNLDGGFGYAEHGTSNSDSTGVAVESLNTGLVHNHNYRTGVNYLQTVQNLDGSFQYDVNNNPSVVELNTAFAVLGLTHEALPVQ